MMISNFTNNFVVEVSNKVKFVKILIFIVMS